MELEQIVVRGDHESATLDQLKNAAAHPAVRAAALCADGHLGYAVPVGGVLAYRDHVSPAGVGVDIGCGNKAVRLDVPAASVRRKIGKIMDMVVRRVSFGVGRVSGENLDHPLFESEAWKIPALADLKKRASQQLGTVGGGNHYCNIMVDEQDRVWVGVHFGSRGLGALTAKHYNQQAKAQGHVWNGVEVLPVTSELGQEYLAAMHLAGDYAYAGRDYVCRVIAELCDGEIVEEIHNHHNFAWQETHFGERLWVVRKGSTPAFPGQKGFVGASMAEPSVILEGVESPESAELLYSTVHGAGRAMSRTAAKGKKGQPGRVTRDMMEISVRKAGVTLRGGDVDEAMHCYKRLDKVLAKHRHTVRVLHTLTPIGVAMAGPEVVDPYKD